MSLSDYLTPENIRLVLSGLVAGSAVGLAWRAARRVRWGAAPFLVAVGLTARYTGRTDWFHWHAMAAGGVAVTVLAGVGAARLLADPAVRWEWVAAGALFTTAGVWAGVPETGPAVLTGGGLTGLVAAAVLTRACFGRGAGPGMAAVIGWAAVSGATGRPWATIGGALCTGVAPWFAVRSLFPVAWGRWDPGPWLLGVHMVLVVLASRWIGVVPDAGWLRVAVVATGGLTVAAGTRRRA